MKLIRLGICVVLAGSMFNAMAMDQQKLSDKDLLNRATDPTINLSASDRINLLKQVQAFDPQDKPMLSWALVHTRKQAGLNIDIRNNATEGWTPLMLGAYFIDPNAVRVLLELGADTTLINTNGKTAHDLVGKSFNCFMAKIITGQKPDPHLEANCVEANCVEIKEMLSNFKTYREKYPEKFAAIEKIKKAMGPPASGKLTISNNN